jgi:hypothetical protein
VLQAAARNWTPDALTAATWGSAAAAAAYGKTGRTVGDGTQVPPLLGDLDARNRLHPRAAASLAVWWPEAGQTMTVSRFGVDTADFAKSTGETEAGMDGQPLGQVRKIEGIAVDSYRLDALPAVPYRGPTDGSARAEVRVRAQAAAEGVWWVYPQPQPPAAAVRSSGDIFRKSARVPGLLPLGRLPHINGAPVYFGTPLNILGPAPARMGPSPGDSSAAGGGVLDSMNAQNMTAEVLVEFAGGGALDFELRATSSSPTGGYEFAHTAPSTDEYAHGSLLEFEPLSGMGAIRRRTMQFSARVASTDLWWPAMLSRHLPVYWVEHQAMVHQTDADRFRSDVYTMLAIKRKVPMAAAITGAMLLFAFFVHWVRTMRTCYLERRVQPMPLGK